MPAQLLGLILLALALGGPLSASAQATPTASSMALVASPSPAVTNESVTLFAAVNANGGSAAGTIAFFAGGHPISGCSDEPVTSAQPTATCVTTFAAAAGPAELSAIFTPAGGSTVAGATGTATLSVGRAATSTAVAVPSPTVAAGARITYTATVSSAHAGSAVPSGKVQFRDQGRPIAGCSSRTLAAAGATTTATCQTASQVHGTHAITALYRGDDNFLGATSPAQLLSVQAAPGLGPVNATMQWTFFYAPAYAKILNLLVHGAAAGAAIHLGCQGGGCPFQSQTTRIVQHTSCRQTTGHRCASANPGTVQLSGSFGQRALGVGTRITVAIVEPQRVGKYYSFTFRARRGPVVTISCLAPGALRPGDGC